MIDAGQGHRFFALVHPCKQGEVVPFGYMWMHWTPDGRPCSGVVRTCEGHKEVADEGAEYWKEEKAGTLTPSLLCKRCQLHGFLRKGKWVETYGVRDVREAPSVNAQPTRWIRLDERAGGYQPRHSVLH